MIKHVRLQRFKQFRSQDVDLLVDGITLVAGGNNSGKSTLLQALAVWEFCRTAIEMERGRDAFLRGSKVQGLGLGDDEFSPVAIPSLKHLWTNLKTQKETGDPDGYTLRIACTWDSADDVAEDTLEFGLALANDRLFVKVTASTLETVDTLPTLAYLPPFAGITDRETKVSKAIRRRRTGEGLAGAVLRNLLLEMQEENERQRVVLREGRSKISDADLRRLRLNDPWELLQQTLRTRFGAELIVDPFSDEYHSYIRVDIVKGEVDGYKLKRHHGYNRRDLMVEGSGFLQWLSVYALATSPDVDTILLDEPDAHLHPTLQTQLMESLAELAQSRGKQVLVATHSTELLRHWEPTRILNVRSTGRNRLRYLRDDSQKVGLLVGIGSAYAPRLDPVRAAGRVLFVEGSTDRDALEAIAKTLGNRELENWPMWVTSRTHKERKQLFRALAEEIPGLRAVSLRDRDDENLSSCGANLADLTQGSDADFTSLKWRRRHLENYLLHPAAVARATGRREEDVRQLLADDHSLAIGTNFTDSDCPDALALANGKSILVEDDHALLADTDAKPLDVARCLRRSEVCDDIKTFFEVLASVRTATPLAGSSAVDSSAGQHTEAAS
jgi:predicted ATPase